MNAELFFLYWKLDYFSDLYTSSHSARKQINDSCNFLVYFKLLKTVSLNNSRVFIGLAIMGYEPLYYALQIW